MNEQRLERKQVEWVFGLTGGELHEPDSRFPHKWDHIRYWYEGPPDWTNRNELGLTWDDDVRTIVACLLYGDLEVPEGWEEVTRFASSGETECPDCGLSSEWNESPAQELARKKTPLTNTGYRGNPDCPLCEGGGYIYIGEGWYEITLRHDNKEEEGGGE